MTRFVNSLQRLAILVVIAGCSGPAPFLDEAHELFLERYDNIKALRTGFSVLDSDIVSVSGTGFADHISIVREKHSADETRKLSREYKIDPQMRRLLHDAYVMQVRRMQSGVVDYYLLPQVRGNREFEIRFRNSSVSSGFDLCHTSDTKSIEGICETPLMPEWWLIYEWYRR